MLKDRRKLTKKYRTAIQLFISGPLGRTAVTSFKG